MKTIAQQLKAISKMSTNAHASKFDEMLQHLNPLILNTTEIQELYEVFDDQTEHHEVMFGLIHVLDKFVIENPVQGINCFLAATFVMHQTANEWMETLLARYLNSECIRSELKQQLKTIENAHITKMLISFKNDTNTTLAQYAQEVLEKIQTIN